MGAWCSTAVQGRAFGDAQMAEARALAQPQRGAHISATIPLNTIYGVSFCVLCLYKCWDAAPGDAILSQLTRCIAAARGGCILPCSTAAQRWQ